MNLGYVMSDLQHLVPEPPIRDRIAIVNPADADRAALFGVSGFAIWASVSDMVRANIRDLGRRCGAAKDVTGAVRKPCTLSIAFDVRKTIEETAHGLRI